MKLCKQYQNYYCKFLRILKLLWRAQIYDIRFLPRDRIRIRFVRGGHENHFLWGCAHFLALPPNTAALYSFIIFFNVFFRFRAKGLLSGSYINHVSSQFQNFYPPPTMLYSRISNNRVFTNIYFGIFSNIFIK